MLSRGFVRRALEIPLGGLESEIDWMYYKNGKLRKVLREARALIDKSKNTSNKASYALPSTSRVLRWLLSVQLFDILDTES